MSGSTIQITYDGTDITNSVIHSDATFEMQMNAIPGQCRFRVRDASQTMTFTTGKEVRLFIDSVPMWGGFVRRVSMTYPFEADDTSSPSTYSHRIWMVEGADYNILWDSLVLRNTADYVHLLPSIAGTSEDGWAIWNMLYNYSDFPTGFGITSTRTDASNIEDIRQVSTLSTYYYKQQGTKLRDQMDEFAKMSAAIYYIGADKTVHYESIAHAEKRWGFSDSPNYASITSSPATYQNADWGFREVTGEEDGSLIVNDALVWGGSPIGSNGSVIFARVQDAVASSATTSTTYIESGAVTAGSSQALHGRWQYSESNFDGGVFGNLAGVKARAQAVIDGPPGTSAYDGSLRGLRYPQWVFRFTWFADKVPYLSGVPDHIVAGDLVSIKLGAFGVSQFAPARTITISFPEMKTAGVGYVQIDGEFSYSYTDSVSLWKGILDANQTLTSASASTSVTVTTVNNSSTSTNYGDYGTFTPVETADGTRTLFTLPNGFGYIAGTLEPFVNGLLMAPSTYTETSPSGGTVTFTTAPAASATIILICRTTAS